MTKDGLAAIVWKYQSQKKLETFHLKLFIILSQYSFSYRHFERSEKSSLHKGQRESVRGGAAEAPRRFYHYLMSTSLTHEYIVPLRRKRSLDSARDDDTRKRTVSHFLSFPHVESCPCGAVYPPPSARPFFKGLLNCHVKTLTLRKVSSPISSFREKTKTGNPVFHTTRNHGISCSKALTQVTSH